MESHTDRFDTSSVLNWTKENNKYLKMENGIFFPIRSQSHSFQDNFVNIRVSKR
jgi:hypothetical protein